MSTFFDKRRRVPPVTSNDPKDMSEDQLGEQIRNACLQLGWDFKWLRKTINSSEGILDLKLTPIKHLERRRILERELKGYTRRRLGQLSDAQVYQIQITNAAGGDAALWIPDDWYSGQIEKELL